MSLKNIQIIAIDADDTLWDNEHFFREAEQKFAELLADYMPEHSITRALLKIEIRNLESYGYGIKSFMLSMIETALHVSENTLPREAIWKILDIGKEMLRKPVVVIDGVEEALQSLKQDYRLVMATKGDLRDQEKKLEKSGLAHYFHHTEVMSEKNEQGYRKLIRHLDVLPKEFMMIGNSLKSDIIPVLKLGGFAVHIPYHITWEHERIDTEIDHENFYQADKMVEVLDLLG